MCVLMLWNQEKKEWYQVDPQSIPPDRSYLVFCEQNRTDVSTPECNEIDYHGHGWTVGTPHTKNTLCPRCQELVTLADCNHDKDKKCVDN